MQWPLTRSNDLTLVLGTYGGRFLRRTLRLNARETATHKHVMGLTGQGKSRLLQSMFELLFAAGSGVALIDPHRDLALAVIRDLIARGYFSHSTAYKRLIYIDFARDRYTPFNVLAGGSRPHNVASGVLEAFHRAWPSLAEGSAPQFDTLMLSGAFVLTVNGEPLTMMHELLTQKAYRERLLIQVSDPAITSFFHDRFDKWGREQPLMLESTLRRIFLMTFSPTLRYSLGQRENWLDFRRFIDDGVSVIFDLGGVTDPDARHLIGCLISVGFETAALSRTNIAGGASARGQYHLIIDEFAEFVAQSDEALSRVLSQCRKFGLFLTLSHQTHSQSSERLRGALGNCGCHVYFKLSRADAELTARSLGSVDPYTVKDEAHTDAQHDLYLGLPEQWEAWTQNVTDGLSKRQAYVKTFERPATLIRTLDVPDADVSQERLNEVLETYSRIYQRSRDEIDIERTPTTNIEPAEHIVWQRGGDRDVA